MAKLGDLITTCNGRLTLTSGTPVTTSDVTAATTLYYTPYKGDNIALYNGEEWLFYEFEELSLSLSGYTADTNYDIWMYDNSGVLTLDSTAWSDATTRATALATQNGVYTKTGDILRRYLGTIRTTSTTGQCEDSQTKRYCWNYYNQFMKVLHKNTGWSSAHAYGTATVRYWNNDTSMKMEYVCGETRGYSSIEVVGSQRSSAVIGYGYDTSTNFSGGFVGINPTNDVHAGCTTKNFLNSGYHYFALCERGDGGSAYFNYAHVQAMWMC